MKNYPPTQSRERGASLIVALLFLVVMAMISVSVANVGILEERMTGSSRDREIALQAAEAAQRDAEVRLMDSTFRATAFPAFDATRANTAAYWENCFVNSTGVCAVKYTPQLALPTTGSGAVSAQPQFIVERKPNIGTMQIYRVTARAQGGSPNAVVVLQAEYGFTP